MNEDKKEELAELMAGWVFLSPLLAYIFKVDPFAYLMFLAVLCYAIIMIATWPKQEVRTP